MTIKDIISDPSLVKENDMIFARKVNGKFSESSEVAVLDLTDEEHQMDTSQIAEIKCPGFDYFLEAFMIKEMIVDFDKLNSPLSEKVEAIIHYGEYDA